MLKSENDSEVEIILSKSSEIAFATNDKPLSPILNSSNLNRKFLFGKRTTHKKIRRKLIDKFEDANSIPTTSVEENIDSQLPNFTEESFSLSQSEDLMNCLDRLEEIEQNRDHAYKLLVRNKKSDFCFKKPISPAPNKTKKIKHDVPCSKEMKSDNVKNENIFHVSRDIPKLFGFQTATGKQLSVSEQLLKKHENLFEDILTPSQQADNIRKKKYNFLSKTKCCSFDTGNENQSYGMAASCKERLKNLGLSTETDGKEIITSSSDKIISDVQESISLTQEICNSEISNSQIIFAADKALGNIHIRNDDINSSNLNAEFRGFNLKEILKSDTIHQQFTKISNDLYYLGKLNDNVARKDVIPISSIVEHQHLGLGKHMLDNLDLPPTKRLKQELTLPKVVSEKQRPEWKQNVLSPLETFSRLSSEGFLSASGKSISISSNSMKRAKNILDEIELEMIKDKKSKFCEENKELLGHKSLNNNSFPRQVMLKNDDNKNESVNDKKYVLKESNSSVENTAGKNSLSVNKYNSLKNIDQPDASLKSGTAAKSKAPYSVKDKLKFFDSMIENEDLNSISTRNPNNNLGFSTASGTSLKPSDTFLKLGKSIFVDIDENTSLKNCIQLDGPSKLTAQADAKNKLKIMDEAIRTAESKIDNKAEKLNVSPLSFGKCTGSSPRGFVSASRKPFSISDASMKASYTDFDGIKSHSTPTRSNLDTKTSFVNTKQVSKKKLGVTSCKQIPISETKLNRAKQLFQEEFLNMSPIRPVQQSVIQTSTPLRHGYCASPVRNTNSRPSSSFSDLDISESTVMEVVQEKEEELLLGDDLLVTFSETTRGNGSNLISDLEEERKRLEKRLKVITERQDALADLKKEKLDIDKKPRLGVMYEVKLRGNKVPIISFVDGKKPGETCMRELFCISPQNAENIHFKEFASKISTNDCAIVVPNSKDLIGLPEIDYALRTMPGVEARLIPKGWIRNHYKWIIWKLASYERMFPLHFTHSLSVEHVVQQLKYRYDREIDKAERPALRKIYEKDDAPQKRIILCVSDIKKVDSDKFELELTDGWYGIRTVIDDPLCNQIRKEKIKIGTKLMTCGAELMNCDGCSPLEATDLTYLKVNFNCTRRAIWNARLGYQRFPGPFPIQIHSVHPLGGPIGAIQITVARIYPTKYLEKLENQSVWRNKRAEERRAQEWEVDRCRKMEQIENDLRRDFSSCFNKGPSNFKKADIGSDISQISCPEMLLSILEKSNDPDSLQEKLSSSQRLAVVEYKRNLFQQKQQEMSSKMTQNADKLKMLTRDVVPILKMLVVDINGSPTRAFNFTVWHPTESHYQILREGISVNAHNVLPKMNGDLSCSSKTIFKPESPKEPMSEIFRRKVIEIGELSELKFSVNFSEFDTVGLVVQLKIGVKFQEVWLADLSGRLLLISIYENPSTCLLLDNLRRAQAVTVCNLRFRNLLDDVSQATGNHFTVFSLYSQHKHLREYLETFKKTMPKCCDKLLEDCDNKIERFRSKTSLPSTNLDESDEDTLVSSRITSTDLALSLIDMDKYT